VVEVIDTEKILRRSSRVLLVDWPSTAVPRTLLNTGFEIFGVSPSGYSRAQLLSDPPEAGDTRSVFPPEQANESGYLVFQKLEKPPERVDIVHAFRPAAELEKIFETQVVPLGATALWLQPPVTSEEASRLAAERGVDFVEGVDIVQTIRALGFRK
jgi:predicted CoA-binding protein